MECPMCSEQIDLETIKIEQSAEEDGIEVNFICPACLIEQYAVLQPGQFEPVD